MNQTIWDGGTIASQKLAIQARSRAQTSQYEVDIYALNERVNGLFFGILLFERQIELNDIHIAELQRNHDKISSYMAAGVANQSDLDAVEVEIVGAGQNRVEMQALRTAYVSMLSAMIGESLAAGTYLVTPRVEIPGFDDDNNRPELELFDALGDELYAQRRAVAAKNMPRFNLFAQGAYGNPGLNMFKDQFTAYAIGGVRLGWNFGGLYTRRRELADIETAVRGIQLQKETFLFNTSLQDARIQADINKYDKIMRDDDRIIALRVNIRKASEAKVDSGTMSATDLVRDINAEQSSRRSKAMHEIELLKSIYELKNNKGNP